MLPLPRLPALTLTLLLAPLAWGEAANPELPRARQLLDELRYADAAQALLQARAQPGNDRDTLLQILALQGVVAAMLQQPAQAREAFQTLLVLAPEYELKGDYAPRVMTPFFEAKAWVGDQGTLRVEAAPATQTEASIERVAVRVASDPLNLSRAVRFHTRADGEPWSQQESLLLAGDASVQVQGGRVQWWAELLGEHQAVLAMVGSAEAPRTETSARHQALTELPRQPQETSGPGSRWRTAAYVSMGVAVGAGATGGFFGLRSRSARSEVQGADVDERGLTTGLTQREAYALDERARSSARLANLLFGVAGAAAIAGGTFWVLDTQVEVSATPMGVAVGGTLP